MSVIAAVTVVVAPRIVAMEPGTRANEDAAYEEVRPVIAIWRAIVGIIIVVAVIAYRSRTIRAIKRPDSNGHRDLCVRAASDKEQQSKQSREF
jgi:uncharacterized membrane protein YozB (DUF420 family)